MEGFLSTLPPYVHSFLDRYPPTEVFTILRELICFAVLYSDDRTRINQSTKEYLEKRKQSQLQSVDEEYQDQEEFDFGEESEPADLEINYNQAFRDEINQFNKAHYSPRTGELIPPENNNIPNNLSEWWDNDFETPKSPLKNKESGSPNSNYLASWTPWDNTKNLTSNNLRRMDRPKSQMVPSLRSYLEEDESGTIISSPPSTSPIISNKKRHSMFNIRTPLSPLNSSITNSPKLNSSTTTNRSRITERSVSVSPDFNSPTSNSPPLLSRLSQASNKPQSLRETAVKSRPRLSISASSGTSVSSRASSVQLKPPGETAAAKARAEYTRLQRAEQERRKSLISDTSSITSRLKQRANSSVDWDLLKRERRSTISESSNIKSPRRFLS